MICIFKYVIMKKIKVTFPFTYKITIFVDHDQYPDSYS